MKKDLNKFYQAVANDPKLGQEFESITERENFSKLAVQMGSKRGYRFTASEVESSIQDSTASEQGEYFCLPIGCWHRFQPA